MQAHTYHGIEQNQTLQQQPDLFQANAELFGGNHVSHSLRIDRINLDNIRHKDKPQFPLR
jgi:hypothetical protein